MRLPRLLREALHRRYCCECSAWEDLALEGLADEAPNEPMATWKPVQTPTGTVYEAEMNAVTVISVSSTPTPPPAWGPLSNITPSHVDTTDALNPREVKDTP